MLSEVTVPKFAEGAVAITLKQWLCKKGDRVEEGAAIAEAATDKIAINIEAPAAGYVVELRAEEGRRVKVGQVIALLSSEPPEEK
jgi:pyruvate/2-oxoglutarate dehydrogenase complex dihydrolipoamide acyltransferase (E2) component